MGIGSGILKMKEKDVSLFKGNGLTFWPTLYTYVAPKSTTHRMLLKRRQSLLYEKFGTCCNCAVFFSYSKHHTAAQQTLYQQLLQEHRRQQQRWEQPQEIILEDDEVTSDVIGDADVTGKQLTLRSVKFKYAA